MSGLQHTSSSVDLLAQSGSEAAEEGREETPVSLQADEQAKADGQEIEIEREGSSRPSHEGQESGEGDSEEMDVQVEGNELSDEMMMSEAGPSQPGKRVKVYELRDSSWFDRGTGFCKGVYDDMRDVALIVVEAEDVDGKDGEEVDGPGGFFKEDFLLSAKVEKEDIYARQQDTLIVWTEPHTNLDIALSFQDAEGCDDIWGFICEVQRHLNNLPSDSDQNQPSSPSRLTASPPLGLGSSSTAAQSRSSWQAPTLANIKDQEMALRMSAKSATGRDKAVERILGDEYIKLLIGVFEQAEDLESLEDLHAICSLMQTILLFNDNGIFEYILQDDIFLGVIGMLEYDPDFPNLKASYRQFFQDTARFREVVEIKDLSVKQKIHQTYRLLYLKDVVLARVLDDPTFGILNGFVFFNQVDIINHIQNNDAFLVELFSDFKDVATNTSAAETAESNGKKRDVVIFLHQLMLMGKGVQLPGRLALYRNLIERGLLFVCEWSFGRTEPQVLHAAGEILTLAVEHDANAARLHMLKEVEAKRRTLILEIIELLTTTKNMGLLSQMADVTKTLLEIPPEGESLFQRKDGPITENFLSHFYESGCHQLFKPLIDLPEITPSKPYHVSREQSTLLQHVVELLSFCVPHHAHRASYFILSNPIAKKVVSLLYVKDKPLRHAALRFVRACFRANNSFLHRNFVKGDLLVPLLALLEEEGSRDNMLSSACMEVLDLIRKENIKVIINYLFDNHRERLEALGQRPFLRAFVKGLTVRWEQINEPPPAPPTIEAESSKGWSRTAEAREEDYFNASDDDEPGPKPTTSLRQTVKQVNPTRVKRRKGSLNSTPQKRSSPARGPGGGTGIGLGNGRESPTGQRAGAASGGSSASGSSLLGLDYDDGSDSDGSNGAQSPRLAPSASTSQSLSAAAGPDSSPSKLSLTLTPPEELESDLGDVAMRMRAKRQREEEEEEGFAGLLLGNKAGKGDEKATDEGGGGGATKLILKTEEVKEDGEGKKDKASLGGTGTGSTIQDAAKKIKLNFGFGKKFR